MKKHIKKAWPELFQDVLDGKKNFDLRLADWKCEEGDILILKEWDPKTKKYTGRELSKEVNYIFKFKIDKLFWTKKEIEKHGIQVLSLK